jgi:hypothetical protein
VYKNTRIIEILKEHHIVDYFWYVYDILIVYNTHTKNIDVTLTDFNTIRPTNTIHHRKRDTQQTKLFRPNHHGPTELINLWYIPKTY